MDIDLNADLGEGYGPWRMGEDEARHTQRRGELEHNVAKNGRELDSLKQLKLDLADQKQRREAAPHPSFREE